MMPDLSGDAFLRRHQTPKGLILRCITFLVLFIALWTHWWLGIGLALLVEAANWLFCPEEDSPPEWLEQVLDMEFAWLDLAPGPAKLGSGAVFCLGFALLVLGLWAHHVTTILMGFFLMACFAGFLRVLAARGP